MLCLIGNLTPHFNSAPRRVHGLVNHSHLSLEGFLTRIGWNKNAALAGAHSSRFRLWHLGASYRHRKIHDRKDRDLGFGHVARIKKLLRDAAGEGGAVL